MSNVVPIPKGKKEYRPISLLCASSKILEKIFIRKILLDQISDKFNANQFAFTSKADGGCTNALLSMRLNTIHMLESRKGYVELLAVDFSKAFDTVPHSSILRSLKDKMSADDGVLQFVQSFLSHRTQRVISSSGEPCCIK